MDALERVLRLGRDAPNSVWSVERYWQAAVEGKERWQEIEYVFGIAYPMWHDAVAMIDPTFVLTDDEVRALESATFPFCSRSPYIAAAFVRWERCPVTAGLPNPYEPWIEILEHGGSFDVEHGRFIDVFGHDHTRAGSLVVRRA